MEEFMKKLSRRWSLFGCAALVLSVLASLVEFCLLLTCYEPKTQFYVSGAVMPTIHHIWLVLLCAAFIVIPQVMKDSLMSYDVKHPFPPASTVLHEYLGMVATLLILAESGITVWNVLKGNVVFRIQQNLRELITILRVAFSIPGALYFYTAYFQKKSRQQRVNTLFCGIGLLFWTSFRLLENYFSLTGPINAPLYLLGMFVYMSFMLYTVFELRFLVGRPAPLYFRTFTAIFVLMGAVGTLPQLLYALLGKGQSNPLSTMTMLVCTVSAALRLIALPAIPKRPLPKAQLNPQPLPPAEEEDLRDDSGDMPQQ